MMVDLPDYLRGLGGPLLREIAHLLRNGDDVPEEFRWTMAESDRKILADKIDRYLSTN